MPTDDNKTSWQVWCVACNVPYNSVHTRTSHKQGKQVRFDMITSSDDELLIKTIITYPGLLTPVDRGEKCSMQWAYPSCTACSTHAAPAHIHSKGHQNGMWTAITKHNLYTKSRIESGALDDGVLISFPHTAEGQKALEYQEWKRNKGREEINPMDVMDGAKNQTKEKEDQKRKTVEAEPTVFVSQMVQWPPNMKPGGEQIMKRKLEMTIKSPEKANGLVEQLYERNE